MLMPEQNIMLEWKVCRLLFMFRRLHSRKVTQHLVLMKDISLKKDLIGKQNMIIFLNLKSGLQIIQLKLMELFSISRDVYRPVTTDW